MYEKRLCILKQIRKGFSADGSQLTGAVYAERLGSELILTPRIPALAPMKEGRYALAVSAGGKEFVLELRGNEPLRVPADFSIRDGFCALVCFVRGEAEPIAFGACGGAPADYSRLLKLFSKNDPAFVPKPIKQEPEPLLEKKSDPIPTKEEKKIEERDYDDEAIADVDYYGDVWKNSENADHVCEDPKETDPACAGDRVCENEADESVHPFESTRGTLAYYHEIAPKLKEAMQKYPRDEHLESVFPNSEWVKAENGLLGIVYAEGQPRYLCVAMKTEPPQEVKDASIFVPASPYDEEEGYYIVFQDADTGEYIAIEEA